MHATGVLSPDVSTVECSVRVLVVSESAVERARATSLLRSKDGMEVIESGSARDAKQQLVDLRFDVVVIDGNLSPQGGYSFLYEAREAAELAGLPSPPALVLTSRQQDEWLAGWAQAQLTLPLPADPFAVARAVQQLAGTPA